MLSKIKSRYLEVTTADGSCDAYVAYPEVASKVPGLLLYMDAVGLRPRLEEMACRLASQGYFVLVPNLFYRQKKSPIVNYDEMLKPQNFPELMGQVRTMLRQITPEMMKKDAAAFVRFFKDRPEVDAERLGGVGYCMGGGMLLRSAAFYPEDLKAVASFHAGNLATEDANSPHLLFPKLRAQVYIGHADQDASMPPEQIERVREALKQTSVKFEAELYVGAKHGWTMADLLAYNAEAEEKHWERLFAFFKHALI